jgi:hypothetical protein
MSSCSARQSFSTTGAPLNATNLSPGLKPAAAAGVGGAPGGQTSVAGADAGRTHSLTCEIVVVFDLPSAIPIPMIAIANRTTARIRFWNGPAAITMILFQGARV